MNTTCRAILVTVAALATAYADLVFANCDCGSTSNASACTARSVSISRGTSQISFEFSCSGADCLCGKYANGWDYWVAPPLAGGDVQITSMQPATTGAADSSLRNGWIANPNSPDNSGLDGRLGATGTGIPLNPSVDQPYLIKTGHTPVSSIVKSISKNPGGACTDTAADGTRRYCFDQIEVLTVVAEPPANAGSTQLRPPYFGPMEGKQAVSINSIKFDALSSLPLPTRPNGTVVSPQYSPSQAIDYVKGFKIDWMRDYVGTQAFKASSSFPGESMAYSPGPWGRYWDAMQWLALEGISEADKRSLAIWAVQHGEDIFAIINNYTYQNGPWVPNGGHSVGRYGQAVLAAALVEDGGLRAQRLAQTMSTATGRQRWAETGQFQKSAATGRVTYGAVSAPNGKTYNDCTRQVNPINVDPLGLVDNSKIRAVGTNCIAGSEGSYQSIAFPATWSQYNLLSAIPAARALTYDVGIEYVTRMTNQGLLADGDVFDPALPTCSGGPNAGLICYDDTHCGGLTCGNRRPNLSSSTYNSYVANNMWKQYQSCYRTDNCPGSAAASSQSTGSPPTSPALMVQ
jgi:hypothetical protein